MPPELPSPAPFALRVPPYSPGMNRTAELRLSANEGPPPRSAAEILAVLTGEHLCRYPDPSAIEARLAAHVGVDPQRVLVTAGADDAIDRVCRSYLCEGRNIVLPSPTFEMFGRGAALVGAEILAVPWGEGEFPLESMLRAMDESTSVAVVVSPDNPTGRVVDPAVIEALARAVPNVLVVLDAAYEEFADRPLTQAATPFDNVLVLRTLSKAWSLAGARVGFAVGHPDVIALLRGVAPPYAVSGLSMAVAEAVLDQADGAESYVRAVRERRAHLRDTLLSLGVSSEPSQTNFVLFEHERAQGVRDALERLGILVRAWPHDTDLGRCLRVTCPGNPSDYDRLVRALRTVLRPEAILLDMDGVMIDVSRSYREAIRQTAGHFGVELTQAEIDVAKAGSNVNNDWRLTHDLLCAAGAEVSLDEVTAEFEKRYQGSRDQPGLKQHERALCSAEWLADLATRFKIGVVTGRPRKDALEALERFGFRSSVSTVVPMEDAPAKPDPAPVELALERLDASAAWMCGDTPDDVHAALGAHVLPVGIGRSPGLTAAGAWRVCSELEELSVHLDVDSKRKTVRNLEP